MTATLCGTCANRETCDDHPDDMVLTLCTSYDTDGATEYEVTEGGDDEAGRQ